MRWAIGNSNDGNHATPLSHLSAYFRGQFWESVLEFLSNGTAMKVAIKLINNAPEDSEPRERAKKEIVFLRDLKNSRSVVKSNCAHRDGKLLGAFVLLHRNVVRSP